MANNYYYEQPYEDTTTTTTTTTTPPSPSDNRRRLTIILLVVIGVFIILALLALILNRPSSTGGNNNNSTGNSQKVTLQFWGAFLDPADIKPLLDDYHAQNPNITIEYANKWPKSTVYSDAAKIYRDQYLNTALKSGDPVQIPDIFMVNNTWVGDYDGQYSAPGSNFTLDSYKSIFYPAAADDFAHDGIVHGVPLWMDTLAVLYNKDLLAEKNVQTPPTNWNDFRDLANSLTKRENGNVTVGGFANGIVSNTRFSFGLANLLLLQNGVNMLDDKGQPAFATFGNSTTSALQTFYENFGHGSSATWSASLPNDAAAFLEGKAAMILTTSYRYRDIKTTNDGFNLKINMGISQVPQITGQSQSIINWADYWGAMVSSGRPNSSVAWDFLKWLTQPDQLKKLSTTYASNHKSFGLLYPRKDMQQLLQSDPDLQVFNNSLPYAKSWYMVKGIEVENAFNTLLNNSTIDISSVKQTSDNVQLLISNKEKI